MALTTINSEGIEDGSLKNIDVKSDAAIAGTKIAPDFGSQNIVTTGNINIGTGTGRLDSSGIIKTAHGTEAAPSHTFINDPDNGMFRSATNQIAFSTGGSTALTIDSSGKVGIGETDPDELLHIASTGTVKFRLTDNRTSIADNSQYGVIQFEQRDSNTPGVSLEIAALMTDTSNGATALQIKTGTPATITERLRIDSNGRVMIGTTTKGHSNADDLTVNNSGNCGITIRSGSSSDGNIFFADAESDTVGALKYEHDDNAFQINVDGDERLRIASNFCNFFSEGNGIAAKTDDAAGTSTRLFFGSYSASSPVTGGTISFNVWSNGDVQNTNDSYGQISDVKLKENIVDAGSQWDDFKAVRFRKYNFKEETGYETHTQLGVIAQELALTSPGLVYETADQDEEGNDLGTTTKAVKSSILTKKALVALQEAMDRIETLETEVAALKAG